mgnify:CR=1 FL=1
MLSIIVLTLAQAGDLEDRRDAAVRAAIIPAKASPHSLRRTALTDLAVHGDEVRRFRHRIGRQRPPQNLHSLEVQLRGPRCQHAPQSLVHRPPFGELEDQFGQLRCFVRAHRNTEGILDHSGRLFKYCRNGPPRSYRFKANSTVACRKPSLSPAS